MRLNRKTLTKELLGKHVVVVGGTTGLGLALCQEIVTAGASVTIIARGTRRKNDEDPFEHAKRRCSKYKKYDSQEILCLKADASSYEQLLEALRLANDSVGKPHWVINCAGVALPGYLRDQLPEIGSERTPEAESQIRSNYYTSLNLARAVSFLASCSPEASHTVSNPIGSPESYNYPSRIVFVGSVLSIVSFIGYSAYAASKYALKGLSDTLRSELLPFGVKVHICALGNIDTDAFERENELKPDVTKRIEGKSKPESPESVAACVLAGLLNDRYCITNDILGEVFRIGNNGIAPRPHSIAEVITFQLAHGEKVNMSLITPSLILLHKIISMPLIAIVLSECCRLIKKEVMQSEKRF